MFKDSGLLDGNTIGAPSPVAIVLFGGGVRVVHFDIV